ncbi:MAG: glycine C-acetyltransferase [candidate division Zixibacteria bacterium]|nr:glycine C-acetyltransferase [candidate division Zixibacteria bacterium]
MIPQLDKITKVLSELQAAKTFKYETMLESAQGARVKVGGKEIIMLASNNYLGLASHPKIREAAIRGIKEYGFGMSSVRFICGTQVLHRKLEEKIAAFCGTEDAILYLSCFSANEGFFAGLFADKLGYDSYKDVIYSDRLNHASIIDGNRLTKAETTDRKIYAHGEAEDLARQLEGDKNQLYRFRVVATDGVFSMEGDLAPLPRLVELCNKYQAILMVDDSHGMGVVGNTGKGTAEGLGVWGKVDVLTGTLGKALGGAAGGFIASKKALIEYLRQNSRPYIFSNSLPPPILAASLEAFNILDSDYSLVEKLHSNTAYFRKEIVNLGFKILHGSHPIVPVMLGDAALAQDASAELLKEGVYVKGLWYPVVPKGEARLRVQVSAALEHRDLNEALEAFKKMGEKLKII